MKKWLKRTLIITGSVIGGIAVLVGGAFGALTLARINRSNDEPAHVDVPEGNKLVFARNRSLYDKEGNLLRLRGVNAGNVLVTEGWLAPYSCGALTNDDGSLVTDKDGNVEYPDLTQEEVVEALKKNGNMTDAEKEEIMDLYRRNWFSEDDFTRVKEVYHMNAIRLPFYWRDILNQNDDGSYSRKSEDEAFAYLDWFVKGCQDNDLYCILDLHGCPKTQNGYEHSGSKSEDMLWNDETAINATCDLWSYIATHYLDNPLGEAIATYDIMNEPCGNYQGETKDYCFPVFDKVYQAIRATGDNHVITIEGCWTYSSFIDPAKYGWENVQYEIHLYCWPWLNVSMETYYSAMEFTRIGHDFNVPYFLGEFTFFSDEASVWATWLDYFEKIGFSWALWTYKKVVVGWWNDNWGLENYRLYLDNNTHEQKVDLRTATFLELKEVFEKSNTSNCNQSTSGIIVSEYLTSK